MATETFYDHWSPAEHRADQVAACAPHIPAVASTVSDLPKACEPFHLDLYDSYSAKFKLRPHDQFLRDYSPGPGFNRQKFIEHAKYSSVPGGITGGLVLLFMSIEAWNSEPKPQQEPRPAEQSRFVGNAVLKRRWKNKKGYFEGLPLDCEVNEIELGRRAGQLESRRLSDS